MLYTVAIATFIINFTVFTKFLSQMKNDKHVIQIESTVESNLSSPLILGIFYIYSNKMEIENCMLPQNQKNYVKTVYTELCR